MKKSILFAVLVLSVLTVALPAATTLSDNFNNGVSSSLWQVVQSDAAGAPWTVAAPDASGRLKVSKAADNDPLAQSASVGAGIKSLFAVNGDFSVFIDFSLLSFPIPSTDGYNEILLTAYAANPNTFFETLRFCFVSGQFVEGYSGATPIGVMNDSTTNGKLGISRTGQTMSAWIDRGSGSILLGSLTSPSYFGAMTLQIAAVQQFAGSSRPTTPLDVRFDNFSATADSIIIPEPMSILLIGLGGLLLSRRKK